jgi:hypothetical protein
MTAPWAAPGYPTAVPLVPQQSMGMRVTRSVLTAMLVVGWFWDAVASLVSTSAKTGTTTATGLTLPWTYGSGLASLVTLILLIVGPQPRWATKWAWFWLLGTGPMSAVFLLVEPVPVWQSEPAFARPSRLTGGWAFLIALFGGFVLSALANVVVTPWLTVLRGVWGMATPGGSAFP